MRLFPLLAVPLLCCATPHAAEGSCSGSWGETKSPAGKYVMTAFGCWRDRRGVAHGDSVDNCVPACLEEARAAGVCLPDESGPECERRVTYFTADAGRFGCLARLRIRNPANGRSVVAVALDLGPSCRVERSSGAPVLDASGRINRFLFGSDQGPGERASVRVEQVDERTPLGEEKRRSHRPAR